MIRRMFFLFFLLALIITIGCNNNEQSSQAVSQSKLQENVSTKPTSNEKPVATKEEEPKKTEEKKVDEFKGKIVFRNVGWTMTEEQVREAENIPASVSMRENTIYLQNQQVDGKDVVIFYDFIDGKLEKAGYLFEHNHSNKTDYVNDYEDLKEKLTEKYGEPIEDKEVWKDDLWKDNPEDYGLAVATGDLVYLATWETKDTKILIGLHGDNYDISLGITYESKDYEKKSKKEEEEKSKKEL